MEKWEVGPENPGDEELESTVEKPEESAIPTSETIEGVPKEEIKKVVAEADKGLLNKIRKLVNSKVQESKLPTKEGLGYESTIGVYGGKLVRDPEDHLVYDTRGFFSRLDKWGDRILRSFDEHHARNPVKMLLRNPKAFLKLLPFFVDSKRYRGTPEQSGENIKRFALEDMYAVHPWGIEVKQPEVFSKLIALQDIFRQDIINHPAINDVDRFDALGKAADYMRELHETAGGIAEGNAYMFLFKEKHDNEVEKPTLMIPTEVYNPEKNISPIEQKTTDLLDLLVSTSAEEYRRSKDWESVRRALQTVLEHYGDEEVIKMVVSYVKRGRLTLPKDQQALEFETSKTYKITRPAFSLHNTQRLTVDPATTADIRKLVQSVCEEYVEGKKKERSTQ